MSTKCFFSGVESKQHFNACVSGGVDCVLTSYFQFYNKGNKDQVRARKKANPDLMFMVDSGAHSFIVDWKKFQSWTKQDFEDYVAGYVAWLRKNKDAVFAAVELDIDYTLNMLFGTGPNSTVGTSMVEVWQKKYFLPLQEEGIEIIYVWHDERGMEGWEDMCQRYSYVGLPGEMSSNPDFNKFMTVARRYSTRVHGFAATKQADFRDWPWYSVDSITWKTSEMYGTLIDWNGDKQFLKFENDKSKRVQYRDKMKREGFDGDAIVADTNYKEVTRYALHSMWSMVKFYDQRYKDRLFFYDLRLPHSTVVLKSMSIPDVHMYWKRMRPEDLFKDSATEKNTKNIRMFLAAISAVQRCDVAFINQNLTAKNFLQHYFPTLFPLTADISVFQKEMSVYLSPPNPPALQRLTREQFAATNNPPKSREAEEFSIADLEHDVTLHPVELSEL